MNTKLNKKLNPYLYPFKMKFHENILYPQIVFQIPVKQFLNKIIVNSFQVHVCKSCSSQRLTNLATQNGIYMATEKPNVPLVQKIMAISNETLKHVYKNSERPEFESKPNYLQNPITLQGPKSKEIALEIPKVTGTALERPQPINSPCTRPKPRYMVFERPESRNIILGRPVPEIISWTRIDRAQKRLDNIPTRVKVAMGVVSGMVATTAVHPLDVIKVRLQLFPKKISTLRMLHRITVCEGQAGLYAGLTAGLLRQLMYTGSRLYVYNSMYDQYKKNHEKSPGLSERLYIGILAGLVGAFMGTPSEMALVRMIEVRRLRRSSCSPPCSPACKHVQRPEGAIFQLLRIARREGVATWWRGVVPTLIRSVFISTAQVGVYSQIREVFTRGEYVYTGWKLHLNTAIFSSLVSALLSLPVDSVKTRYQSYQERHRTITDIFKDIVRTKGVRYLWKGFTPYYVRQVIHTVISYLILDGLINQYSEFQEATLQPKK